MADFSEALVKCVRHLVTNVDNRMKPGWCKKMFVLVEFECDKSIIKEIIDNSDPLLEAIDSLGLTLPQIRRKIQLSGLSAADFDSRPNICCSIMVEFETDYASFQIVVQT